jgi:hypothetical protein
MFGGRQIVQQNISASLERRLTGPTPSVLPTDGDIDGNDNDDVYVPH